MGVNMSLNKYLSYFGFIAFIGSLTIIDAQASSRSTRFALEMGYRLAPVLQSSRLLSTQFPKTPSRHLYTPSLTNFLAGAQVSSFPEASVGMDRHPDIDLQVNKLLEHLKAKGKIIIPQEIKLLNHELRKMDPKSLAESIDLVLKSDFNVSDLPAFSDIAMAVCRTPANERQRLVLILHLIEATAKFDEEEYDNIVSIAKRLADIKPEKERKAWFSANFPKLGELDSKEVIVSLGVFKEELRK